MSGDIAPIRILTVDDHPLLRDGVAALIATQADMILVAEASTGREAIEQFRKHRPDVVLMDLQMPHVGGIEAMNEIRNEFRDARFIVLTTYRGDSQVLRAIRAGTRGYLLKSALRTDLIDVIRAVHSGRKHVPAELASDLAEHAADAELTAREAEVLRLVAAGNSNKLIAAALSVAEETIKGHVKSILSKLGANDRTHAVTIALKRGIIDC